MQKLDYEYLAPQKKKKNYKVVKISKFITFIILFSYSTI